VQRIKLIGQVLTLKANVNIHTVSEASVIVHPRAAIFVEGNRIKDVMTMDPDTSTPDWQTIDHGEKLILPGFIDLHCHYPQLDMIGCFGEALIGWLEKYTFPEEMLYSDQRHAINSAKAFINLLACHGTTTAVVFSSSHKSATQALFTSAKSFGYRLYAGLTAMDKNAPQDLLATPEKIVEDTYELISQCHAPNERLHYCLTPRFAPSLSEQLLSAYNKIFSEFSDIHLQTHYAESTSELTWVKEMFPSDDSYLDVYLRHGLIDHRSLLAHGIHLQESDFTKLRESSAKVVHCPSSNLFLGSGLFPMQQYIKNEIQFGLGSDVGAGTSFSIWATMAAAYQVQKLQQVTITPQQLFYMATLGGADCLERAHELGCIAPGYLADFQVLDPNRHDMVKRRFQRHLRPADKLFALMHLSDDRILDSIYIDGKICHHAPLTNFH